MGPRRPGARRRARRAPRRGHGPVSSTRDCCRPGPPARGPPDQLREHLQVAAGEPGQLGAGVLRDGSVEGTVEQGAELVGLQGPDLHADQVAVARARPSGRTGAAAAHGPDEEQPSSPSRAGRAPPATCRRGGRCRRPGARAGRRPPFGVVRPGGVEEARPVVVPPTELGGEIRGQQVGERAEGDLAGRRVTDGLLDHAAAALGEAQRLLGQPRLADAGGARTTPARAGSR